MSVVRIDLALDGIVLHGAMIMPRIGRER
jgi:hypothetical protein